MTRDEAWSFFKRWAGRRVELDVDGQTFAGTLVAIEANDDGGLALTIRPFGDHNRGDKITIAIYAIQHGRRAE